MKKHLMIFICALITGTTFAQTNFGVHVGGLASQVTIKGDEDLNSAIGKKKFKPGFKLGVFAEVPLTSNLYLNPELNYTYRGGLYKNHIDNSEGKGDVKYQANMNFLELPVNLLYKMNPDGGFYFGAGPTVGMGLSGELKVIAKGTDADGGSIDESESTSIKFDGKKEDDISNEDDNLHLKRFEIGLNAFAGYELKNGLRFQLQYRPNFTNLSPEKEGSFKTSYLGLSVVYRF